MTSEQINLVEDSFKKIGTDPEVAAELFYHRLFEIDPHLRDLFKGDLIEQGRKLMQMIGVAVKGLGRIEELAPALRSLGSRHADYGVQDRHYDTVAAALLWTLEKALGSNFTSRTKEAWIAAYTLLATTMKSAGHEHSTLSAVQ